jgi:hypothetical protein
MRSAIFERGGNASRAGKGKQVWRSLNGHEGESRTQPRRTWSQSPQFSGGQGVHREVESEGHEEKYRAVIDGGCPKMNRSAKGGARSSLHYEGEGVLIHPPHQGVCGWHGTEEQRVTSGGLAESAVGTGVSRPISASEVASDALSVDGRLCSTSSAVKAA